MPSQTKRRMVWTFFKASLELRFPYSSETVFALLETSRFSALLVCRSFGDANASDLSFA